MTTLGGLAVLQKQRSGIAISVAQADGYPLGVSARDEMNHERDEGERVGREFR